MNLSLVYFDLETGGLSPEKHPIIQLAAVATDAAGEVTDEFEAKIAFDASTADPKALAMNHFSTKAWVGAEPECVVLKRFATWLTPHSTLERVSKQGQPYRLVQLGGHNAGAFDLPFLQTAYRRHGLFFPADYHVVDTVTVAFMVSMLTGRRFPSYKLADLCAHYQIPLDQAHDALADVRATARLAKALLAELRDHGASR